MDDDADLLAVKPTLRANLGGIAVLAAGLFTLLLGFQTSVIVELRGSLTWAVAAMFAVGLAAVVCGWSIRRQRGWAALGGTVTTTVIALGGAVWVYLSFSNGLISLLALMVVPIGAIGMLAAIVNVSPALRADAARRRLAASGLEL